MSIASSQTSSGARGGQTLGAYPSIDSLESASALRPEATEVSSQRARPLDLAGRAVLLATDGSEASIAGAHVALALAKKYHATIQVISVVDTRPAPMPPPLDLALAISDAVIGAGVHQQQEAEVRATISAALGQAIAWPIRITLGTPAGTIVKEAQRVGAALIIVGLRRHGRLDRAVHDETAVHVMRNAACPVLGVVSGTTDLPTRVLAAVDFTETSLVAARTARAVVGDGAVLVLAYVPPLSGRMFDDGESVIHDLGVQAGFARTVRELGDEGITFDHVVLHHELPRTPAEMILEYAEAATSDLIAAGSVRHGRLDRWILGSVSRDLVRDGRRSVLIVPPRGEAR